MATSAEVETNLVSNASFNTINDKIINYVFQTGVDSRDVLYYVDTTVTNGQQKKIPKRKKLSVNDNIVCCQNLLLNQTVVDNHIFSAAKTKLRKYKSCHEDLSATGTSTDSKIVPFAVDALGNFCSVSIILLKKLAKVKF